MKRTSNGPAITPPAEDFATTLRDTAAEWEEACKRNGEHDICEACEEAGLLREAADRVERLDGVLREIAGNGCGIPGHAVAVGCGSNYIARKALDGTFLRICPDCHGRGWKMKFTWSPNGGGASNEACPTCQTTDSPPGYLLVAQEATS